LTPAPVAIAVTLLLAVGCGGSDSGTASSATVAQSLGSKTARLALVGDIACASPRPIGDRCHQAATYEVAKKMKPDRVLVIGDTQYPDSALRLFKKSYAKSWGKLKPITLAVPGNHEYKTPGAAGYFDYFGAAAGERGRGWHATTIGGWRVIGLNSVCDQVGGCGAGSAQSKWLANDLKENAKRCTLAFWHYPRFSSGPHNNHPKLAHLWSQLNDAAAEVVFAGHDHEYERLTAMTSDGKESDAGMASFVVGTGGVKRYASFEPGPGTLAHSLDYGVLQLDLYQRGYSWKFVQPGGKIADSGSAPCR
jgi:hypothetical protein